MLAATGQGLVEKMLAATGQGLVEKMLAATEQGFVKKMQQQWKEALRRRCLPQTPGWFVESSCSWWSAQRVACFELATLVQRMHSLDACVCVGHRCAFSSGGTGLGSGWNVNGSSEPEVKWKAQQ